VLRKRFERGLHLITPQISKEDRAARVQPYLQQRKIRLPRKAPWLAAWEAEIFSFPSTMYDDQVDTLVYFASYAPKGFRIKASIEWFSRPPPGRLFSYF
jgi:predicted phage terminase large subunit-like protein